MLLWPTITLTERISDGELRIANLNVYGRDEATGFLVPPGDAEGMALCIERLLGDTIGFDE